MEDSPNNSVTYSLEYSQDYILVIGQSSREMLSAAPAVSRAITQALNCPVVTTTSPSQAIETAQTNPPYLVILSDDDGQTWTPNIARQIRQSVGSRSVVIVALTSSSECSWPLSDDGDTHAGIDGFFVEPMSSDILYALHESAIAKKQCSQPIP
ncbi:MAG: hypothetical protein AAFQ74_14650 [Cyanobacteria bacterium J06623_4]